MQLNSGSVASNFIIRAFKEETITIYGDGAQSRSLCYVDDMVDALTLMMNTEKKVAGTINVGQSDEYIMLELAEKIISIISSKSKIIIYGPLPDDDPKQRKPDITLAQLKLG